MEPARSSDASSSRNSVFFQNIDAPSPPKAKPPLRVDKAPSSPRRPSTLGVARRGHVKRASFGRISMEQRESERERIRADHSVDIRVFLEREYKLGEGRNAEVYLGAYRRVRAHEAPQGEVRWDLCAVKRMQVDQESQLAGLDEVFALRRLGTHPHIVDLVAVVDEVSLRAPPPSDRLMVPAVGPPDLPRFLILLEYLPHTLGNFVKREPHAVDLARWTTWAQQLTSTVEWLHARGCVHGDIKVQNVLLTADLDIKLCDFTSVLFSNAAVPATDCLTVGTPAYSAPELFTSSRWTPSEGQDPTHPALSYTLDIFSLGVLLYSLATGVEPSRRVHSLLAMRQRQHLFFQSEEEDRIERLSLPRTDDDLGVSQIEEPRIPRKSPQHSRSRSTTSISDAAVERLLDPSPTPHGVVSKTRQAPSDAASILRTKSLSATDKHAYNTQRGSGGPAGDSSAKLRRPMGLERAASDVRDSNAAMRAKAHSDAAELPRVVTVASPPSLPTRGAAVAPLDWEARATEGMQPYRDGAPALILPGGGRLPDGVRALIQQMVSPIPEERPTAAQVCQRLNALS
ncbi:hypothetical protein MOBT1_003285 [Malassezia obtusa]|uniref:Protein kinase domain-containing protein n=1 Tax=Malassezia obtusa TaxID=76774 RepID=A0AAF0E5D0_9BASI|nr:hypothetical protein MOBT1_003285 [Malassezia obtusa]